MPTYGEVWRSSEPLGGGGGPACPQPKRGGGLDPLGLALNEGFVPQKGHNPKEKKFPFILCSMGMPKTYFNLRIFMILMPTGIKHHEIHQFSILVSTGTNNRNIRHEPIQNF